MFIAGECWAEYLSELQTRPSWRISGYSGFDLWMFLSLCRNLSQRPQKEREGYKTLNRWDPFEFSVTSKQQRKTNVFENFNWAVFLPSGPLYFSPKCRKHVYRLYHNTRDCTIPACEYNQAFPSLQTPQTGYTSAHMHHDPVQTVFIFMTVSCRIGAPDLPLHTEF